MYFDEYAGLDDQGFESRQGLGFFPSPTRPDRSGAHQWVPAALSLGVKRPEREADNSLPSSAEVKNAGSYTSTIPISLHGVVLS
jgi:hypothetical protein